MVNPRAISSFFGRMIGGYISLKAASLWKISYIVGSYTAFFSATSIAMPLLGAYAGTLGSVSIFLLSITVHSMVTGSLSWAWFAYHIPGLCAALYWSSESFIVRLMIPLFCMVAFVVHPVGNVAYPYALYWFIPITLYFIKRKTIFMHALHSTFIAHAVGSVVWLYTVPMTAQQWIGWIPVVALERLVFASGMVVVYYTCTYGMRGTHYLVSYIKRGVYNTQQQ